MPDLFRTYNNVKFSTPYLRARLKQDNVRMAFMNTVRDPQGNTPTVALRDDFDAAYVETLKLYGSKYQTFRVLERLSTGDRYVEEYNIFAGHTTCRLVRRQRDIEEET